MASTRTFPLSAILFAAILICQWHHLPENAGELLTPPILSASGKNVPKTVKSPAKHDSGKVSGGPSSSHAGATGFANNKGDVEARTDQRRKMSPKEQEKKEENSFTCKDEEGRNVAWFIAIKETRSWRYTFATANNTAFQLGRDIRTNGPVHKTLLQTRGVHPNTEMTFYAYTSNGSAAGTTGHQNGVFLFGRRKGFWLIHSWRRLFSHFNENFQNVNVSRSNGQSFICTTHNANDHENILEQLKISRPNPETGFQNLGVSANGENSRIKEFTLEGQHKVVHFSKWETENRSIYTMIADEYGIDGSSYKLSVQSWQNAQPNYLIDRIRVHLIEEHKYPHLDTRMNQNTDHSKWCVPVRYGSGSYLDSLKFVCIGDLNMHIRGGGAMCLFNDEIAQAFRGVARP